MRKVDDERKERRRKKALLKSVMQDGMGEIKQEEERMAREFMHGSSLDVARGGGSRAETPEPLGAQLSSPGVAKRCGHYGHYGHCGGEQQVRRAKVEREGGGDRDRGDGPGRQGFDSKDKGRAKTFDGGKDTDGHGSME